MGCGPRHNPCYAFRKSHLHTPASISLLVHSRHADSRMQSPEARSASAHFAAAIAGSSHSMCKSRAAAASCLRKISRSVVLDPVSEIRVAISGPSQQTVRVFLRQGAQHTWSRSARPADPPALSRPVGCATRGLQNLRRERTKGVATRFGVQHRTHLELTQLAL